MSLFKSANKNPSQVFGGSSFGGSSFGGSGNGASNKTASGTGYSQQQSLRTVKPSSESLFNKKAHNPPQPAPNAVSSQSAKSFFTNAAQAPPRSLFGKSNATQSAFGGNHSTTVTERAQPPQPNFPANSTPQTNTPKTLFGKKVQTLASPSAENYSRYYSAMKDLTPDELAAFAASSFTLGCIPLKLPPQQFCGSR